MVKKVDDLLAEDTPNTSKLAQVKLSLEEKLDVIKQLDSEILDLVDEERVSLMKLNTPTNSEKVSTLPL